jgi:signal transduction histidine kinase
MPTPPLTPLTSHLRRQKAKISDTWESRVRRDVHALERLGRAALIDHLPEFLDALADWIDGDDVAIRRMYDALVDGHALQRLGHHVELATITREYAILRTVILRELLEVPSLPEVREALIRFNEGMDHAVEEAVLRYTRARDESRERFVGILGHDLRNPLNAITMAAGMLEGQPAGAAITRSAARMARMIDDVIDFARVQLGGGIPIVPTNADLGAICAEALEELRAAHPKRTLTLVRDGDLRGAFDRDRVVQAMSNLIGNAIQHGNDPIEVRVFAESGGRVLVTEVRNRLRSGAAEPSRGLGLGLYIVEQIALAHGAVSSASVSDGDMTFAIRWPRSMQGDPRRDAC